MKSFIFMILAISTVGCTYDPYGGNFRPNGYGDGSNTPSSKPISPFVSSRAFPVTGFSGCNDEAISCNCNYTSAYHGAVVPTRLCNSGYHQFVQCQGVCPGGDYPWATNCICR